MDWLTNAADFVLSVSAAVLSLAAAVFFAVALGRSWKQSRRTEVVIETVADATGDATTASAAVGLTYRLRERVVATLPVLAENARRAIQNSQKDSTSPIGRLLLEDVDLRETLLGDITSSQSDLTESMESMVPQAARGAYRFVASSLLRPKQVRVLGVLQRVNDHSGGLGLSFTVNHIGAEEAASRITLWDDEDGNVEVKAIVERFHALVAPAARALACELLRQRLRVKMSERRRRRKRSHTDEDREAVVEFLVGRSYQGAAHRSAPATRSFYEQAEQAFTKSDRRLDHYKLSYQRANALAELGRRQGADTAKAIRLLGESTKLLEEAKRQLPVAGLQEQHRVVEELTITAALTTNACLLAEFLPDDDAKAKSAAALAAALSTMDPARYESDSVLYNVACALAVAARVGTLTSHGADSERCLERSKVWLLYAGARNEDWWTDGPADPDLRLLHEWMPEARRQLSEVIAPSEGDTPLDGENLTARIDEVLKALTAAKAGEQVASVATRRPQGRRRRPQPSPQPAVPRPTPTAWDSRARRRPSA